MKYRLLLLLAAFSLCAWPQPWSTFLDPSRAIDWTNGVGFAIPNYTTNCATQPTLTANSVAAAITNRQQMQTALASCDATHNVVNIPAGTYYIYGWNYGTQGRQVVRGAGPLSTSVVLTASGGFSMQPANPLGWANQLPPSGTQQCLWSGGFTQGSTTITLSSCIGTPTASQLLILSQANDSSDTGGVYICDSYNANCAVEAAGNPDGPRIGSSTYSQQQVTWINSVTNNGDGTYSVAISPGVYFSNVRIGQTPFARWPNTVQNEGLENITIDHSYISPAPTAGTPTSGGSCSPGTHTALVVFVYPENFSNVLSTPSAASSVFTCVSATGQTVPLTIPTGPTGTIARNIYVTKAGNIGNYFLVAANTINDNTTTSYSFSTADTSLTGITAPSNNTPIGISNCYQCWIKNVRGLYAGRDHVTMYQSLSPILRDSYFYEAQAHGSQSYGVELTIVSGALIENNIFQSLVNSIMFGQASGSVIGYNFAIAEGFTNTASQTVSAGHNAGNGMNLFEGNNFFGIWSDDSWGSNSGSTLFRNVMRGWESGKSQYTYAAMVEARNRGFNIVGNILGQPNYHTHYESYSPSTYGGSAADVSVYNLGWSNISACGTWPCDSLARSTLMRWGNWDTVTNATKWDSTEASPAAVPYVNANFTSTYFGSLSRTLPASLYYASKPSWWPAAKAWPPIGPDVTGGNVGACQGGTYDGPTTNSPGSQATSSGQCTGGTLTTQWASHITSIPAQDCYLNVMGGPPDGSGNMLNFDASRCYTTYGTKPSSPTGLTVTVH
jgi:hypothetical protein